MGKKQIINGRASSFATGLFWGGVISALITILMSVITAKIIQSEIIREGKVGYCIMLILFLAAYSGAIVSCKQIKRRFLMVSVSSAFIYILLLMMVTALFFGGEYTEILPASLIIFAGSICAFLTFIEKNKGKRKQIFKTKNH